MYMRRKESGKICLLLFLAAITACKTTGGFNRRIGKNKSPRLRGSDDVYPTAPAVVGEAAAGKNVMRVTVNGDLCGPRQAPNQACVAVTICEPNSDKCQTINNLLLDTGSVGLRVFASIITLKLPPVTVEGGNLAECIGFADQSSEWGPVVRADVKLAEEPAVSIPIQLIDANYAKAPGPCSISQSVPDLSPQQTGFNGILGVGLFPRDYPPVSVVTDSPYYACAGNNCTQIISESAVLNPVAALPTDNNGVIIKLPLVGPGGATSVTGSMLLGIGTQDNNQPTGMTAYPVGYPGIFTTQFTPYSTRPVSSFIDSGSNHLVVPSVDTLPLCDSEHTFVCPQGVQDFSAKMIASGGNPSGTVDFKVANAASLLNSENLVFATLAARGTEGLANVFDWGLPFFFGRSVAIGFEGKKSTIGKGIYWAY